MQALQPPVERIGRLFLPELLSGLIPDCQARRNKRNEHDGLRVIKDRCGIKGFLVPTGLQEELGKKQPFRGEPR